MGWTADNQSSTFFAVCARLIGPEVKITLEQSLPGNLSVEDWQAMKEVLSAVREGLPSADQMPPSQVFERVLSALRQADAKLLDSPERSQNTNSSICSGQIRERYHWPILQHRL
jgi:hypothetical protein